MKTQQSSRYPIFVGFASVENDRLNLIISSVKKADSILGKQAANSETVMKDFFREPRGSGSN